MTQMVEHLPSKHETLNPNPSTTPKRTDIQVLCMSPKTNNNRISK
jgi:hypothetical protein